MIDVPGNLLREIEAFLAERGMSERAFGLAVANNHKLISRLRSGRGVQMATQARIKTFMAGGALPPLVARRPQPSAVQASAA